MELLDEKTFNIGTAVGLPPPGKGTLSVDTTPVKGEIYIDGVYEGIAPLIRDLDPGEYIVSFGDVEEYTTPGDKSVTLAGGATVEVIGEYKKPIPIWGWIAGGVAVGIGALVVIIATTTKRR